MFDLRPVSNSRGVSDRKNNLSYYNPFRDMDEFERRFFGEPMNFFSNGDLAEFKTDISDRGDSYLLEADLPGFAKNDIKLDINGDVLTINAERHSEKEEKDKGGKYLRCERSYGSYSRSFDISGIDIDTASAKYEDGVLRLTLPKKQKTVPEARRLEIQ